MTVWHDDGETLFEATWPAVAYAAATAWQSKPVDDATWHRTFARAFFGSDDPRYAADLDALQAIRPLIRTTPSDPPDYLFWRDPFDPRAAGARGDDGSRGVRNRAETALAHLWDARPPLHAEAVAAMRLGALRYDQLARRLQIGKEARDYYEDARAHATKPNVSQVYRSLGVAKYLCWETAQRTGRHRAAVRGGVAQREHRARARRACWRTTASAKTDAQRCADRIDGVMREDYLRKGAVPPWDEVMPAARGDVIHA